MTLPALDARLRRVAGGVRDGARLADVGCGHGYLICTLALEGRIRGGVACDLREGPLAGARALVETLGLGEGVSVRRCDGLCGVRADEADDIAVAGMGGETIAAILSACPWVRDEGKRLILQPQSKAPELRRWLWEAGFELLGESGARAGRFRYAVMTARYCGKPFVPDDFACLVGLLPRDGTADSRGYLGALAARLRKAGAQAQSAGRMSGRTERWEEYARRIEALL